MIALLMVLLAAQEPVVHAGSKKFTESVLLGEIVTQLLRHAGADAVHDSQLGGTRILWSALRSGEIDVYPEYTGTLRQEILQGDDLPDDVWMSEPLGFNNTYALGLRRDLAGRLGLSCISDLAAHPELRVGFSEEFMRRADGWPGLRRHYQLPQEDVRGLDHDLAYRALESGSLDVIDCYTTDAEIRHYDLVTLEDDRSYFPAYHAVLLARADLDPDLRAVLARLTGRIDAATMTALNARAKLDRVPEAEVAATFLEEEFGIEAAVRQDSRTRRILRRTGQHLALVGISLGAAILLAIPLGILAARRPRLGQVVLGVAGVVQTIPSLALLVFMIPLLGIGAPPAIVALFLYSVLPILRNTTTGLTDIPRPLRESAEALGLSGGARLWLIELPLASRAILAGIKTSAVINIGTATLGALIGAGGYGQPILTGIRLDDVGLILEGAVPAAALALLAQGLFEGLEHVVVPRGLR